MEISQRRNSSLNLNPLVTIVRQRRLHKTATGTKMIARRRFKKYVAHYFAFLFHMFPRVVGTTDEGAGFYVVEAQFQRVLLEEGEFFGGDVAGDG